jgi:uncharacterized membrane protein
MDYIVVKWLHIVSSTILFGTGIGSAFYMLFISLTKDVRAIAVVSRYVVRADWIFTSPTVLIQPLTGFYLVYLAGYQLTSRWIFWSIILYLLAGACWLPVVWIQIKMRNMAEAAARNDLTLPRQYWHYLSVWTLLGIPAFLALIIVFYLMVSKPT